MSDEKQPFIEQKQLVKRLVNRSPDSYDIFNIRRKFEDLSAFRTDFFHTLLSMKLEWFCVFVGVTFLALHLSFSGIYAIMNNLPCCKFMEPADLYGKKRDVVPRDYLFLSLAVFLYAGFFRDEEVKWDYHYSTTLLVILHSVLSLFWSVFILGSLFLKISSGSNRGHSIIYSSVAVINENADGELELTFRVCESRTDQLVDAAIVCHYFDHTALQDSGNPLQNIGANRSPRKSQFKRASVSAVSSVPKTLIDESNEFHRMELSSISRPMFLGLPATVVHIINSKSPLCPIELRNTDITSNSEFNTKVTQHLKSRSWEVVAEIDGWEPITGSAVKSVFSYFKANSSGTGNDLSSVTSQYEIMFNRKFLPCVSMGTERPSINFLLLHATSPI